MTSDIICDATVNYIIASEQNVDLAFRVAEAMPIVPRCLVKKVVEDVAKKFSEKGFSKSDSRVVFTDYGDVMKGHRSLIVLRKNGWYEHDNKDCETGIHLSSDGDFSRPYICLHLHRSYTDEKRKDIVERFKPFEEYKWFEDYKWFFKEYDHAPTNDRPLEDLLREVREGIMWKYVPPVDDWWESENFFKRAANSKKREEIVERFVRMIDDMAAKIDVTMMDLGRNP